MLDAMVGLLLPYDDQVLKSARDGGNCQEAGIGGKLPTVPVQLCSHFGICLPSFLLVRICATSMSAGATPARMSRSRGLAAKSYRVDRWGDQGVRVSRPNAHPMASPPREATAKSMTLIPTLQVKVAPAGTMASPLMPSKKPVDSIWSTVMLKSPRIK